MTWNFSAILLFFVVCVFLFLLGWNVRDAKARQEAEEWAATDAKEDAELEARLTRPWPKRDSKTGRFIKQPSQNDGSE